MLCPHCGFQNNDRATACSRCHSVLTQPDPRETIGPSGSGITAAVSPSPANAPTVAGGATAITSSPSAPAPAVVQAIPDFGPRYRVESLLGEGGMGAVYKAYDRDLDRFVALKLLRADLTRDPEASKRFKQELLLASRISHKNILRIHDLGDAGGMKFISMAYIEGEDLFHLLRRQGRLPLEQAVSITRQLCAALQAAHDEAVVHRDLKPQNVLIDHAGTVYVSDFGLAKSLEAGTTMLTGVGQFLGTPRYMAPEQVEGKRVDARTDLYALGLIMYELVIGDVPFSNRSSLQMMFARVQYAPHDPRELNSDITEYYARIVLRCLERNPARRYQRASEIVADLAAQRATPPPDITESLRTSGLPTSALASMGADRSVFWYVAIIALAATIINGLWFGIHHWRQARQASSVNVRYIAVMPFKILGQDAALSDVAEGLRDALSAKLFQMQNLRLASTAEVDKLGADATADKIQHKLGATLVVKGSVQGTSSNLRVVLSLLDVNHPKTQWNQEISGVSQDLLTLEDQAFDRLASGLGLRPSSKELARAASHATENIEAYDLYLRGRAALRNGKTVQDAQNAITFYQSAIDKDPNFALAYAGLADATLQAGRRLKDAKLINDALNDAQQASRLNQNLPEAHFALGQVYRETGNTLEAAADLRRALERAPNFDEGYRRLGDVYAVSGRKDDAIAAYKKAIELNPYYWLNHYTLGQAYSRFGQYEAALGEFNKVIKYDPDNGFGYNNIGIVLFSQGKLEESIPYFQRASGFTNYPGTWSNLGEAYFYLKRYDEAIKALQKAVELNPKGELAVGNLADAYRWSGRKADADHTYAQAIELALKDLQVNPRNARTMGHLAQYYAKEGQTAEALQFIGHARAIDPNDVELASTEAVVQTLAGNADQALKSLRGALQKGYSSQDAAREPEFGPLHSRAEFDSLLKEFSPTKNK